MRRLFLILACCLAMQPVFGQTPADRVVPLWTGLQTNPPAITLNWTAGAQPAVTNLIQRKLFLSTGWSTLAAITNPAVTSFADSNVVLGVGYEYKVTRQRIGTNDWGFLYAAIDLPPVRERGTLILVVESNAAVQLAPELARFELDLAGDGWQTTRLLALRKNWDDAGWADAVTNLKAQIVSVYSNDPTGVKAVLLFGHVPVPYSGDVWPDRHPEHRGAWPADVYYGDMDGVWTDTNTTVNNGPRLYNALGDGKFDQSFYNEYTPELMVGRIDLSSLPAFAQPEMELLRQYLAKARRYRSGDFPYAARGLVNDVFSYWDEAFAQNGIRDFGLFFGPSNVNYGSWFPTLRTTSYHAAYASGGGDYTHDDAVGDTIDFATGAVRTVFTMMIGSKFGDWDTTDCILRAPLASIPSALTCVWAGRPKWFSHPMDLGEPIGTVFRLLHGPIYEDYEDVPEYREVAGIHVALMGDPTLRLRYPGPPRNLSATADVSQVVLSWAPAADSAVLGYAVSRADLGTQTYSNLHAGFLSGTVFTDATARATSVLYRVQSMKKEVVRSGSFTNLGQGVFLKVGADHHVNRPPAVTNLALATIAGQSVAVALSGQDPDGDSVFVSLTDWPQNGILTGAPSQLVYSPASGYTGTVAFAYEASDGIADSPTGTVTITVAPVQTSRGTSCAWLIRTLGYTNDYEQAEEEDPDGDGLPTWGEYQAGTDPLDAASRFSILSLEGMDTSNRLTWYGTTNSGVTSPFAVRRGTELPDVGWPWVASNLARHPTGTNTWTDTNLPPGLFIGC